MTNDEGNKARMTKEKSRTSSRQLDSVISSSFDKGPIATAAQLAELVKKIEAQDRVGVDTEADSLHSYREKLCLLQISVPAPDGVDGVANAGPCVSPGHESAR